MIKVHSTVCWRTQERSALNIRRNPEEFLRSQKKSVFIKQNNRQHTLQSTQVLGRTAGNKYKSKSSAMHELDGGVTLSVT